MRTLCLIAVLAFVATPTRGAELDDAVKDIIGPWKLEFTTPDDVERAPMVVVGRQNDDLVAWYIEKGKPEAFKEVRLEDETLLLTIVPEERGGEVTVTFAAKLKEEGKCHGEAKYTTDSGDSGTWDFTGERIKPSSADEVSKWNLSFVTPDDKQREATVTVVARGETLYGWFSSKEHDIPASKVVKNGDSVELTISTKTAQGSKVDVTFRGTVNGDSVKGDANYDMGGETGSFPFTGTRKS